MLEGNERDKSHPHVLTQAKKLNAPADRASRLGPVFLATLFRPSLLQHQRIGGMSISLACHFSISCLALVEYG